MVAGVHIPVMVEEVLEALRVLPGGRYCDGTVGGGGHASRILERCGPDGQLVGFDRDPAALRVAGEVLAPFGGRARLCHGSFADILSTLTQMGMVPLDGLLVDLGMSKAELASALGTVPETLSRAFARLRDEGLIEVRAREVLVLDVGGLAKLGSGYSEG